LGLEGAHNLEIARISEKRIIRRQEVF